MNMTDNVSELGISGGERRLRILENRKKDAIWNSAQEMRKGCGRIIGRWKDQEQQVDTNLTVARLHQQNYSSV